MKNGANSQGSGSYNTDIQTDVESESVFTHILGLGRWFEYS